MVCKHPCLWQTFSVSEACPLILMKTEWRGGHFWPKGRGERGALLFWFCLLPAHHARSRQNQCPRWAHWGAFHRAPHWETRGGCGEVTTTRLPVDQGWRRHQRPACPGGAISGVWQGSRTISTQTRQLDLEDQPTNSSVSGGQCFWLRVRSSRGAHFEYPSSHLLVLPPGVSKQHTSGCEGYNKIIFIAFCADRSLKNNTVKAIKH